MEQKIAIPDGYKVIGHYGRNSNYVYLKKRGVETKVAIPFCLNDSGFNNLASQLPLKITHSWDSRKRASIKN